MEQTTPYRYEAKNDGSYNELAAYVTQLMGNVSLFPELLTIVIDGRFANDVGKFIDKEGLDFFISPIEVDDNNIQDLINTAAVDADTLRKIIYRIMEEKKAMAEANKSVLDDITKQCDFAKKDRDMYQRWYHETSEKADRVKSQVKAIAVLIDSIFPKD